MSMVPGGHPTLAAIAGGRTGCVSAGPARGIARNPAGSRSIQAVRPRSCGRSRWRGILSGSRFFEIPSRAEALVSCEQPRFLGKESSLMMKWLRAHTKQIMVVVVLLAMLSFVGGSALTQILGPKLGKEVYARAFGTDITQADMSYARRDLEVLESLFFMPQQFKSQYGEAWQFGRRDLRLDHWYLLALEAERSGVAVSDQEIDQQMQQFPPDTLDILRTQRKITPPDIRHALARQIAIQKNANHILSSAMPSEPQVRHYALETEEKIRVRFIAVPAERFVDSGEPVSEDELRAQFETNKDFDPADSETGFGYRYPRRVDIQYLVADLSEIAPQVPVSLDAVKSYWKNNRARYTKTIYVDPPPPAPVEGAPPDAPPPEPPAPIPQQVEKSFSEAQPDIERELRQRNAVQIAEQAIKKAQGILIKPWQDVRTDPETGFKPIPPGADNPDAMQEVGRRVSEEFGIPIRYGQTGLITEESLMTHPDLRGAHMPGGTAQTTLSQIVFRVPAFLSTDDAKQDAGLHLQLFQPVDSPFIGIGPQLMGDRMDYVQNRVILFRVVAAQESVPPTDYAEVREKVERDVRLARAFAKAEPTAKELYAIAARLGVEKAMELAQDLKSGTPAIVATSPPAFARRTRLPDTQLMEAAEQGKPTLTAPNVMGVGVSEEFVDRCFAMSEPSWEPPQIDVPETERILAATTQPAAEPAPVVQLISLPKFRKHFVVELAGNEPLDAERYENEVRQTAVFRLMGERSALLRSKWFDPAEIEKRAGYEKVAERALPDGYDGIQLPPRPAPPMF